jgi:hypothetical protein
MADEPLTLQSSLADLSKRDWLAAVSELCEEDGYFEPLGKRHFAAFIERDSTLLVSFEPFRACMRCRTRHSRWAGK